MMRKAGVVNLESEKNEPNTVKKFVEKWKAYAKNVRDFAGFRKASRMLGPLPPTADPKKAAAALSRMAKNLAKKYRSPSLRRLAKELEAASKNASEARKIIKKLNAGPEELPTLERRPVAPETTEPTPKRMAYEINRDQGTKVLDLARNYLVQRIRRNHLRRTDIESLRNDSMSVQSFTDYLENSGIRVSPTVAKNLWLKAIDSLVKTERQASLDSMRNHFYGQDDHDTGYVEGQDKRFASYLTANTSMDEATSEVTEEKIHDVIGDVIEFYAADKNPSKITPEDVLEYLKENEPQLVDKKYFKIIFGFIYKLTHRPARHEDPSVVDDEREDDDEEAKDEESSCKKGSRKAETLNLESEIVSLSRWLMSKVDGLSTARAIVWSKRLVPWAKQEQLAAGDLIAKRLSEKLGTDVDGVRDQILEVIHPQQPEIAPEEQAKVAAGLAHLGRQAGLDLAPIEMQAWAARASKRIACGGFDDRVEIIKQLVSPEGQSFSHVAVRLSPKLLVQIIRLLKHVGEKHPKEVVEAARDGNPGVSTNMDAITESLPPAVAGRVEFAGAEFAGKSWRDPGEGQRFGEDVDLPRRRHPKKMLIEAQEGQYNPWAICTDSVGRENKDKYERCVKDVKRQS